MRFKLLTAVLFGVLCMIITRSLVFASTPKVYIGNEEVVFDVYPIVENGRTLVPLRAIFEKLGATVKWDEKTKTVTAVNEDTELIMKIGSKTADINGSTIKLDVPAKIVDSRTLVPLRFVSESFGAAVYWDPSDSGILISLTEPTYKGERNTIQAINGSGICLWPDGTRYEGEWVYGNMHGKGIMYYPNGETYEGHLWNNQLSGTGKYTWNTGDIYVGEWSEDYRNGIGTYCNKNSYKIVSDFSYGEMAGASYAISNDDVIELMFPGTWYFNQPNKDDILSLYIEEGVELSVKKSQGGKDYSSLSIEDIYQSFLDYYEIDKSRVSATDLKKYTIDGCEAIKFTYKPKSGGIVKVILIKTGKKYYSINLFLKNSELASTYKADSDLIMNNIKVNTGYKEITVSNVQELLDSIGSNRKIILKPGRYNLSEYGNYDVSDNRHIKWVDTYDGKELIIYDVNNLTIESKDYKETEISIETYYSDVLSFKFSKGITLNNITMGHYPDKGYCAGDVASFDYCSDISINNCDFYGCGTYGISAIDVNNMLVSGSIIRDCSYGIMDLGYCKSINFENNIFKDNEELCMVNMCRCEDILFKACSFTNNKSSSTYSCNMFELERCGIIYINDSNFIDNKLQSLKNKDSEIIFNNCTFKNNAFSAPEVTSKMK
ncbi:stalk domain-containing protein [Acetivibrio cellulolyticus]|uniref:stalk domain-containing protein n=1 Tax=Acetivibrio cellulolyticus TaxID=35830 RepID=UPI0001E2FB6D|nr:stalk domain-containing protein [Acetivibrio cellulolyticus]